MDFVKRNLDYIWPAVGFIAVGVSFFLLYRELQGQSIGPSVWAALKAISARQFILAIGATLVAYAALAWYDRIALLHLGVKHISWRFIAACSFTTYALSHNIGASVFSGAMVRYRAYRSKGLSAAQIAILVALCSFTFVLGELLLGGLALVLEPAQLHRLHGMLPELLTNRSTARIFGFSCLAFVAAYVLGLAFRLPPLILGGFRIEYPHLDITARQLIAAPMELLGAAGIIYFVLPASCNPGFFAILTIFLASFSAALASNAPGGLGVFELVFIHATPGAPQPTVLAALLVFRLLYLLIPLAFAMVTISLFERRQLAEAIHHHHEGQAAPPPAEKKPND